MNYNFYFSYNFLNNSQLIYNLQRETFHLSLSDIYISLSALLEAQRPCLIFEVLDFCWKNLHKFVLWQYLIYVSQSL